MRKLDFLFQILTESMLLGFFVVCLCPSILNLRFNVLGVEFVLNASGFHELPEHLLTISSLAFLVLFFIIVLFSVTLKETKRRARRKLPF